MMSWEGMCAIAAIAGVAMNLSVSAMARGD